MALQEYEQEPEGHGGDRRDGGRAEQADTEPAVCRPAPPVTEAQGNGSHRHSHSRVGVDRTGPQGP